MAGVQLRILLSENSYSIANNTSVCTAVVQLASQGKSWSNYQCAGSLWFNGTKYSFASTFSKSTSWQTLYTLANVVVPHWDDGSKTLAASASFATGVSVGTLTASASLNLTQLYRKSELVITTQNIKFGDDIAFDITSKNKDFVHTVWIQKAGTLDWKVLFNKVKAGTHHWTIPEEYARYVTGTDTTFQIYMTTYYNGTDIGSTDYGNILRVKPLDSMQPIVEIMYSDTNQPQYKKFNSYIKGQSKLNIGVRVTYAYDATFLNGTITIDNQIYNLTSESTIVVTAPITSLAPKITALVTDSRGMTGTTEVTVSNVLDYTAPEITKSKVYRVLNKQNNTELIDGKFIRLQLLGKTNNLNGLNISSFSFNVKYAGVWHNDIPAEVTHPTVDTFSIEQTLPEEILGNAKIILCIKDSFNTYEIDVANAAALDKAVSLNTQLKGVAVGKPVEYTGIETTDLRVYNKAYTHSKDHIRQFIYTSGETIVGALYGATTIVLDPDSINFNIPISVIINGTGVKVKNIRAYLRDFTGKEIPLAPAQSASGITEYCKAIYSTVAGLELVITKKDAFKEYASDFKPLVAYIAYILEVE